MIWIHDPDSYLSQVFDTIVTMSKKRSSSKNWTGQKGIKDGLKVEEKKEEPMVIDCFDHNSGGGDAVQGSNADPITIDSPNTDEEPTTSKGKSKKRRKRSPPFTLRRDITEPLKNFSDCDNLYHGYVPCLESGDVIEWKKVTSSRPRSRSSSSSSKIGVENGDKKTETIAVEDDNSSPIKDPAGAVDSSSNTYHLLSAKCKGCKEQFVINNNNSLLKIYLNHCIKECKKYQKLDLIKYCDPCNLYFMDKQSLVSHGKTDPDCPMYDFYNFLHKRPGRPSKKATSTKE